MDVLVVQWKCNRLVNEQHRFNPCYVLLKRGLLCFSCVSAHELCISDTKQTQIPLELP